MATAGFFGGRSEHGVLGKSAAPDLHLGGRGPHSAAAALVQEVLHAPAPMSPITVLEKVKHSRMKLLQSCRTNMVVEMKRAEEERNKLQLKIDEASTSGMKAHLMNTKIEEIISSVVEPERLRALQETDAVTRSTLSEDTLPSQVTQVDCDLSEADLKAVDYLSGALKKEGLAASSAALAASESAFAAAVHTESLDAVDWAMQRQQAAKERNLLHQKRLHLGVERAFNKTESQRSHAEKLHQDQILPAAGHQEATPSLEDYERSWNARERKADAAALQQEQQELKNAVIGKIAVDTGLASGPIVVMVYANDSAESVADDFCATYNKYSAEARNTVLAAVEDSIALNAEYTEDSDWVVLSEMQIVHVDMRRSY